MSRQACILGAFVAMQMILVGSIKISEITKCQSGTADLVGTEKYFTVQICNLFGATCYMNQLEVNSSDCDSKALMIEHGKCGLFPIETYQSYKRDDASKRQVGTSGCSTSCSNGDCKFSGGCVSVQCALGSNQYASLGKTKDGTKTARKTGITDTSTAEFKTFTFGSLYQPLGAKTLMLYRTGNFVAASATRSFTNSYTVGEFPRIIGNNYGPKACPSSSKLISDTTSTAEDLRMCGSTGEYVYFGAANLLFDRSLYAKLSDNNETGVSSTQTNLNYLPFLTGKSVYRSGAYMDDKRVIYLYDSTSSSGATEDKLINSSMTIVPTENVSGYKPKNPGAWRFYSVVFYCDKFDRTDLTSCPEENRKIFYFADPNPDASYGVGAIGADDGSGDTSGSSSGSASGPKAGGAGGAKTKVANTDGAERSAGGAFGPLGLLALLAAVAAAQ